MLDCSFLNFNIDFSDHTSGWNFHCKISILFIWKLFYAASLFSLFRSHTCRCSGRIFSLFRELLVDALEGFFPFSGSYWSMLWRDLNKHIDIARCIRECLHPCTWGKPPNVHTQTPKLFSQASASFFALPMPASFL